MALKSGSINDFANSMAAAMEAAFMEEWHLAMGNQPKPEMNNQMRHLFVAIAKGVVRHLGQNANAFTTSQEGGGNVGTHQHAISIAIDSPVVPPP